MMMRCVFSNYMKALVEEKKNELVQKQECLVTWMHFCSTGVSWGFQLQWI